MGTVAHHRGQSPLLPPPRPRRHTRRRCRPTPPARRRPRPRPNPGRRRLPCSWNPPTPCAAPPPTPPRPSTSTPASATTPAAASPSASRPAIMTGRFSRSHYKTFRQTCTLEAALQAPDSAVAAKAAFAVRRLRRRVSAFINAVAALLDGGAPVVRPAQRWLRLAINGPAENRPLPSSLRAPGPRPLPSPGWNPVSMPAPADPPPPTLPPAGIPANPGSVSFRWLDIYRHSGASRNLAALLDSAFRRSNDLTARPPEKKRRPPPPAAGRRLETPPTFRYIDPDYWIVNPR